MRMRMKITSEQKIIEPTRLCITSWNEMNYYTIQEWNWKDNLITAARIVTYHTMQCIHTIYLYTSI